MVQQEKQLEFDHQCQQLGLDSLQIRLHQSRIRAALEGKENPFIPLVDTCRFDNFGILDISKIDLPPIQLAGIASFIPSAGASSRYYKPLENLKLALTGNFPEEAHSCLLELVKLGAKKWPLPPVLKRAIQEEAIKPQDFSKVIDEINLPKALLPCVEEGHSFLNLKVQEDVEFDFLEYQTFVIAPHMEKSFLTAMKNEKPRQPWTYFIQGPEQSTIRFNQNSQPILDNGKYSMVPGGHGTLASFLPQISKKHPTVHSALIRNIDNVTGTSPEVVQATKKLVQFHNFLLKHVKDIRQSLDENNLEHAEKTAASLLPYLPSKESEASETSSGGALIEIQRHLFHYNDEMPPGNFTVSLLKKLYDRPVNTIGMVPNTENNVGGAPVFANFKGKTVKFCIEAPHVSDQDKKNFLADSEKSTHFNPVFLLAETNFSPKHYFDELDSSWLLAKKNFKGNEAYYHESALYELLSHNLLANVVFVDIPRLLFNPHKSLQGTAGRSIGDWTQSK